MNGIGQHMVTRFQKRWQLFLALEVLLYASGIALLGYALSQQRLVSVLLFIGSSALLILLKKPWKVSQQLVSRYLDENIKSLEYSTALLLTPKEQLSTIAMLQSAAIEKKLSNLIRKVQPKVFLKRALVVFFALGAIAFLLHYFKVFAPLQSTFENTTPQELISFQALDSNSQKTIAPRIRKQSLTIKYPAYSKVPTQTLTKMNSSALEGSQMYWSVVFDTPVRAVFFDNGTSEIPMKQNGNSYRTNVKLSGSFFYNFKFIDQNGEAYSSDLYAIEAIKDEPPKIAVRGLKKFTSFDIEDEKKLRFQTNMSDDFGLMDAYIIATVTKGEGESVKFREERIPFDTHFVKGLRQVELNKNIDLEILKMESGDELYFYIEGIDSKLPKANKARSETYFAVIRDTVGNQFAVEGTMGADLMPDYFRSQRQLIIDTEKLITDKKQIAKTDFNFTSNELGYDQKALRLKYGEFMGDEADSGLPVNQTTEVEESTDSAESSEDDPLEAYTHDHDGTNEHNLVDHDHEEEPPTTKDKEDSLEAYVHNHEDPEASTLFAQSLKSKLRQAMAEMWDAELHLRLYKPENSLPYQYRALKLIQEIKNSARIYVHRIGFDPPPIKEDKRLSGDLEEVFTYQSTKQAKKEDEFSVMRKSVTRLAEICSNKEAITRQDRALFKDAGNEMAALAIENPGNYLNTLQGLKWLSDKEENSFEALRKIQAGLLNALPSITPNPSQGNVFESEINGMMLKEIYSNE